MTKSHSKEMTAAQRVSSFLNSDDPPSPAETGDKTIRFKFYWYRKNDPKRTEVAETYEKITLDPEKWSKDILAWFNSTLRPHETERVFVRCEIIGEVPPAEHLWFKKTAMTQTLPQSRGGSSFDAMQCERCGITGKRFGIRSNVSIDGKWRGVAYKRCDTSMVKQGEWTTLPHSIR